MFGTLLGWFSSYLTNRRQQVKIGRFLSKEIKVVSGVPQGSHLAPILFLIFINDLIHWLRYSRGHLFADDLKICRIIKSLEDCMKLQEDLNAVSKWCQLNGMQLNVSKCFVVRFHRVKQTIQFDYSLNDTSLESKSEVKDLGVYFDSNLNFNFHVNFIVNKALKLLGFIKRILQDFSNINCFKTLFCSYIRSVLEYACQVWSPFYDQYIQQIERVQKKFVRFVAFKMGIASEDVVYEDVLKSINLIPLKDRRSYIDMRTFYKILNGLIDCPELLSLIGINVPQRALREHNLFNVPLHRTNYGLSSSLTRFSNTANRLAINGDIDFFNDSLKVFSTKTKNTL